MGAICVLICIVEQLLRAVFAVPQTEEDMCSHLAGRRFRTSYCSSHWIVTSGLKGLTHSFLNMMLVEIVII